MTDAICKWGLRRFGHRFTGTNDSMLVDVLAFTDIGTELGVEKVTFTVNSTPTDVTSAAYNQPDYPRTPSPISGNYNMTGQMSYGLRINAADYAVGTITITASVRSNNGTVTNLPGSVVIYNDKDGSDSRPNTGVIYVDADNGDDSNDGLTTGTAMKTILLAVEKGGLTPDVNGSSDVSGLTVVVLKADTPYQWGGGNQLSYELHTSTQHGLVIDVQPGAVLQRDGLFDQTTSSITYTAGVDDFALNGKWNGSAYEGEVKVLFHYRGGLGRKPQWNLGDMKITSATGVVTEYWIEGLFMESPTHDRQNNPFDVRDGEAGLGFFDQVNLANQANTTFGYTNCRLEGVRNGFIDQDYIHECYIRDWTGIIFQTGGYRPGQSAVNVLAHRQRYDQEVRGKVDCYCGGKVSVSVIGSRMRITQLPENTLFAEVGGQTSNGVVDLYWHAEGCISSGKWGWRTEGFANAGNNTSYGFPVVARGYTANGLPWVELENPNAVAEPVAQAGASIFTAHLQYPGSAGTYYVDAVHPDVWQFLNDCENVIVYGFDVEDCTGTRIWSYSQGDYDRMAFVNCGDSYTDANTDIYAGSGNQVSNCLFFHCTFGATVNWGGSTTFVGNEVRNCVINNMNALPGSGITMDGNHFVTPAAAAGTNTSTGAWFELDPHKTPFKLEPASANEGTAIAIALAHAQALNFSDGGGRTLGVYADIASNKYLPGAVASNSGMGPGIF